MYHIATIRAQIALLPFAWASAALSSTAHAAPVFYLSNQSSNATPGLLNLTGMAPSPMGTFYLWAHSDVRLSGVSLDLIETGGAIKFTGLEVDNPTLPGRWAFLDGPQTISDSSIEHIGGAAIPGLAGDGVGAGSSAGINVRLASVDYMVTNVGTLNLQLRVGGNGITDFNGNFTPVRFGTINAPLIDGDAFGMGGPVGSIDVPPVIEQPVITPVNLGEVELATTITANLVVSSGPVLWSALTPAAGTPVIPANLTNAGMFSWDPTGSKRGPKGNGITYSWTATATTAGGETTGLAITLSLIPEPTTTTLAGLALFGCLALSRRRT